MTESTAVGPEILNKISAATVCGKLDKPDKPVPLFILIGQATGYKTGQSSFGEWLAFTGQFEATRLSDGKKFMAGKAFMPNSIQDILLSAMNVNKETGEIPSVQFALEIGLKPAKNVIGYEYTVTPLVKPSGNDALAGLRDAIAARLAPPVEDSSVQAAAPEKKVIGLGKK